MGICKGHGSLLKLAKKLRLDDSLGRQDIVECVAHLSMMMAWG